MSEPSIFISIAAYREFELVKTVRDAMARASYPDRLQFCICWQRAPEESLDGLDRDPRFQVIDVPYMESHGVCWARNLIQRQYRGQTYALQIDGHHRFAQDWDVRMIRMLEGLKQRPGVIKPMLTGYLPSYEPNRDPEGRNSGIWLYGFDRFEPSGVVFMRPYTPAVAPTEPVVSRFWSAHFSFSDGCFNEEVMADPHGYFHAEEIGTAVRAWTLGYDFFTPHETLAWHEYSRKGRECHWDDHSDWGTRNACAIARYRALLGVDGTSMRDFAPYGFGTERSFEQFERFAGICFEDRSVDRAVIDHLPAPSPLAHAPRSVWRGLLLRSHSRDICLDRSFLEDHDPTLFLALFATAADGAELYRIDLSRARIDEYLATQTGDHISILMAFFSRQLPVRWTSWLGSAQRGWLDRVDGDWPPPDGPTLIQNEDAMNQLASSL
jgi:hypothetical protein